MALASQKNLFGSDDLINVPEKKEVVKNPIDKIYNSTAKEMKSIVENQPVLAEMTNSIYSDLGAELSPGDSHLWLQLFIDADEVHPELTAMLMYIRGTGAVLVPSMKFGYVIKPILGENAWATIDQYNLEKQCLSPFREELLKLLKNLNKRK